MSDESPYKFIEGHRCTYHDGLAVEKHTCGEYLCKECIRGETVCPKCDKPLKSKKGKKKEPPKPKKTEEKKEISIEKVSDEPVEGEIQKIIKSDDTDKIESIIPKKSPAPEPTPPPPPPPTEDEDVKDELLVEVDEEGEDYDENLKPRHPGKKKDFSRL